MRTTGWIAFLVGIASTALVNGRVIDVDVARSTGPLDDRFRFSVGSDRAAIHLRPTDQRDLRFVHEQCGFQYVRFHGLLDDEMHVVTAGPDGAVRYDWTNVDAVYDALLKIGVRPFVELGFMPGALASGTQTIFYYAGNTTPPKSYEAWGALVGALTRHLTDRYGADEVRRWYFEVWNEPNLEAFWHGTQADYLRLYDVSARAIKGVNPAYRVGGPATAGMGTSWVPELLDHCHREQVPIDFVSSHAYGTRAGALDAKGNQQEVLDIRPTSVLSAVSVMTGAIAKSPMPNLPFFLTEWSTSYSSRDPVHDSYLSAAYILSKLRRAPANVRGLSYWTYSDQFEEAGPVPSPFHGGFGLLNAQGLPKPAYFAYRFLNQLGPTTVASNDDDCWATKTDQGTQLLFWDYTPPPMVAGDVDQVFFPRDWPTTAADPVTVHLDHLPAGDYTMTTWRVGYRHNDVFTAYVDLGKPAGLKNDPGLLPDETFATLRRACSGDPDSRRTVHVTDGEPCAVTVPMNHNDVYLITLSR